MATGPPSTTTACGTSSGRSDDTIKIAGKRLGPAEVESVLVEHPAVLEAAAIGVPDALEGSGARLLLRAPARARSSAPSWPTSLKTLVATRLGKPLRPEAIEFVSDLPKTRNAKVMRRVIRAAYLGEAPGDLSSLENPQAVDAIRDAESGVSRDQSERRAAEHRLISR